MKHGLRQLPHRASDSFFDPIKWFSQCYCGFVGVAPSKERSLVNLNQHLETSLMASKVMDGFITINPHRQTDWTGRCRCGWSATCTSADLAQNFLAQHLYQHQLEEQLKKEPPFCLHEFRKQSEMYRVDRPRDPLMVAIAMDLFRKDPCPCDRCGALIGIVQAMGKPAEASTPVSEILSDATGSGN